MDLRIIKKDIPQEILEYATKNAENTKNNFASFIEYINGEIVERVFGFRRYKKKDKHVLKITEVVRRDTSFYANTITKNMTFGNMCGYTPKYEARDYYTSNGWGYRTFNKEWFDVWYDVYDSFCPPSRTVVNPELLSQIEEFRYCSYKSGDVIKYLQTYREHKGVEFIGKLDLPLSAALINKCEKEKAFRTYLYKHHENVRAFGVRAFIYAYDHNITFEVAKATLRNAKNKNLEKNFAAATQKAQKFIFSENGLTIFPPNKIADLIIEGKALSHCVGDARRGYDKKHANGKSVIMFVRKVTEQDKPFVTVEYDPKEKRILQSYGYKNTKPEEAVTIFLQHWLKEANKCHV